MLLATFLKIKLPNEGLEEPFMFPQNLSVNSAKKNLFFLSVKNI